MGEPSVSSLPHFAKELKPGARRRVGRDELYPEGRSFPLPGCLGSRMLRGCRVWERKEQAL